MNDRFNEGEYSNIPLTRVENGNNVGENKIRLHQQNNNQITFPIPVQIEPEENYIRYAEEENFISILQKTETFDSQTFC